MDGPRSGLFSEPVKGSNNYVPIKALSKDQLKLKADLERVLVTIGQLNEEHRRLRNSCQHEVFFDVGGFPYDNRYCAICDKHLETI